MGGDGKKENSQYHNFMEICRGYQGKNPSIQPRMPHPHLIQHSLAIIIRVRPNGSKRFALPGQTKGTPYEVPQYADTAKLIVPDANPEQPNPDESEVQDKVKSGFIQLIPKLYEKKIIDSSFFEMKNNNVGYLTSADINEHFMNQKGIDLDDCVVEYLVVKRPKTSVTSEEADEKDDRNHVFDGCTSLPGGVNYYGENSLDAVVRNTYEQTGYDLSDHALFCLVAQSEANYVMRYLPNKRVIVAKPFIFCQLFPGVLPIAKPVPNSKISMFMWSYVDFLYKCDLIKHLEYFATESFKRNLTHVKVAHLKIPNSEAFSLSEVVKDGKKCDPTAAIWGVTLGMLLSMLEAAPSVYSNSKYAGLARKQYSFQVSAFNPKYFGALGDYLSKYTVNKYLMNLDKKMWADYEERSAEITYIYFVPTIAAATTLFYLLKRRNNSSTKSPAMARM